MNLKQYAQQGLPGWNGKLCVHYVGYNADEHVHRDVPSLYNANDPKIIAVQCAMMKAAGFEAILHTWQGAYAPECNQNAILMSQACAAAGLGFGFVLDPWCG